MQTADHVLVPLLDGQHSLAQIARIEDGRALLYITRTVSNPKAQTKPLSAPQVVAVLCVDVSAVPVDDWPVLGYDAVPRLRLFHERSLATMDLTDPTLIEAFANAVHGLYPWDGFPDKNLFTRMLLNPEERPYASRMTADFPTSESP
ncbi:MAG: hypothetical protein ABF254_13925 [Octadecabacter sp.]